MTDQSPPVPGSDAAGDRPELTAALSSEEFLRWNWELGEMQSFARLVGISRRGPKAKLNSRVASWLADESRAAPEPETDAAPAPPEPLTGASLIPAGETASEELQQYLRVAIGPTFMVDVHMRGLLRTPNGATLDDAVRHWHATRGTQLSTKAEGAEFDHFTKEWHLAHPGGTTSQARAAWRRFRSPPVEASPPKPGS